MYALILILSFEKFPYEKSILTLDLKKIFISQSYSIIRYFSEFLNLAETIYDFININFQQDIKCL